MKINASAKDIKRMVKSFHGMAAEKIPRAAQRALNRAAEMTQTGILREESGQLGVTRKRLKRRVRFQNRDRAQPDRLRSQVFMVISNLPLAYLGRVKQTEAGARVKGRLYKGAFAVKMGSHLGVYRRPGAGTGGMTRKQWLAIMMSRGLGFHDKQFRFPVQELKESVRVHMKQIGNEMVEKIGEPKFRERFGHELEREFKRS